MNLDEFAKRAEAATQLLNEQYRTDCSSNSLIQLGWDVKALIAEVERLNASQSGIMCLQRDAELNELRKEMQAREKGCKYCKYPESFPIVNLEIDNDDVDEADIRFEFVEPLRFCPICGKKLEA